MKITDVIHENQKESMEQQQKNAYAERIGKVYQDSRIVSVRYDWEKRYQIWVAECIHCGLPITIENGPKYICPSWNYGLGCRKFDCVCTKRKKQEKKWQKIYPYAKSKYIGQEYFGFKVVEIKNRKNSWRLQCDNCGKGKWGRPESVINNDIEPCICNRENYGFNKERLYGIWKGVKSRCENPDSPAYANYGGKGITIEPYLRDSYQNFKAYAIETGYDENKHWKDCTIERINPFGSYERGNITWIPLSEQAINRQIKTHSYTKAYNKDYLGFRHTNGRLTVIDIDTTTRVKKFICRCDCGAIKAVKPTFVVNGTVLSCGCLLNDMRSNKSLSGADTRFPDECIAVLWTINGETKRAIDWCKQYDIPYQTVKYRIDVLGKDILEALTMPRIKDGRPRKRKSEKTK